MNDINCSISQLRKAEEALSYYRGERKKLGDLIVAPRLDWMIYKFTQIRNTNFERISSQIDQIIPTEKLYQDLYEC
jgi:hypothetical protein